MTNENCEHKIKDNTDTLDKLEVSYGLHFKNDDECVRGWYIVLRRGGVCENCEKELMSGFVFFVEDEDKKLPLQEILFEGKTKLDILNML